MRRRWSRWRLKQAEREAPKGGQQTPFNSKLDGLVDCLLDAYINWREECIALEDAYRRWAGADEHDAEFAFAAYRAGLDREEQASTLYGELVRRVNGAVSGGLTHKPAFAPSTPPA